MSYRINQRRDDGREAPFIVDVFGRWAWVRRWWGGHWERWWAEPTQSWLWISMERCVDDGGVRPGGCFQHMECEDHRGGKVERYEVPFNRRWRGID